jgi:hypothetical protein
MNMNITSKCFFLVSVFSSLLCTAQQKIGATLPWKTYEAESMYTNGTVLGPVYDPYRVETESSGQKCVKLTTKGQFVQFTSLSNANSMVVRFSLPDNAAGTGTTSTIRVYKNKKLIRRYPISSHYAWLYGQYPFTNDSSAGSTRHFYDEVRITNLKIAKGDIIKIQVDPSTKDDAAYCILDLVDLENTTPVKRPLNSLSITDKSFRGNDSCNDYTNAFIHCIAKASTTGKIVWIPAGTFTITGDIVLPDSITVQGAGMWYSKLVGNEKLYTDATRRVRIKGNGSNIHIADFAIDGRLNYRNDKEENDGVVGNYGTNSTISRIWIEHTKVGMWIENSSKLVITGCRMRNTIADGINFCVGMNQSTIDNCSARGTGDDCFAIWPTIYDKQQFTPGLNLITHCTAQLPFLANGAAIYGANSNQIKNCFFSDISQGSAILISTTFPTENKAVNINNNFSGTTVVENCDIKTSGGFDHEWDWRGAFEICVDKRDISGIAIRNINIDNSLSNGFDVIAKNEGDKIGVLSNVTLQNVRILNSSIGTKDKHALFISGGAHGGLIIKNSAITDIKNDSKDFTIVQTDSTDIAK